MSVTLLCGYLDSTYARKLLSALNAEGLRGINVVAAAGGTGPRTLKALWKTHGLSTPRVVMGWLAKKLSSISARSKAGGSSSSSTLELETTAQGGKFIAVKEINGEECCNALRRLQVDLMILAGTPIVRAPVLSVPRIGTLNAHQGALPRFRGMNVIEWAIFERAAPTITVHFVDPGVDTGDIVAEEPIPLHPGDTLSTVRERASAQQVGLLARTISAAVRGSLPRRRQRVEEGSQYFSMHPTLRAIAENRLEQQHLKLVTANAGPLHCVDAQE
jgi:methionyl-tRNA formyltransferase